jgi:hypothetical protein
MNHHPLIHGTAPEVPVDPARMGQGRRDDPAPMTASTMWTDGNGLAGPSRTSSARCHGRRRPLRHLRVGGPRGRSAGLRPRARRGRPLSQLRARRPAHGARTRSRLDRPSRPHLPATSRTGRDLSWLVATTIGVIDGQRRHWTGSRLGARGFSGWYGGSGGWYARVSNHQGWPRTRRWQRAEREMTKAEATWTSRCWAWATWVARWPDGCSTVATG